MPEETVTISKEEYDELLEAQRFLDCLEHQGVDNWSGYEFAQEEYNSQKD
jgi:phage pi2 protein 07